MKGRSSNLVPGAITRFAPRFEEAECRLQACINGSEASEGEKGFLSLRPPRFHRAGRTPLVTSGAPSSEASVSGPSALGVTAPDAMDAESHGVVASVQLSASSHESGNFNSWIAVGMSLTQCHGIA